MTKMPTVWILTLNSLVFAVRSLLADTIYVDTNATGPTHDGSSWCDGYLYLQDALAAAAASGGTFNEIRVATDVYKSDQDGGQVAGDREATLRSLNRLTIAGGFLEGPYHGKPYKEAVL